MPPGRACGNMRLVMLNANQRKSGFLGPMGGGIFGMQSAGYDLRLKTIKAAQIVNRLLEGGADLGLGQRLHD